METLDIPDERLTAPPESAANSRPQPTLQPTLQPSATLRIAFLLSRYPALSHTFFLNEIIGLRARGLHLETASINPPDRPLSDLPPAEAAEARQTFYLKSSSSTRAALTAAILHPAALLRGLLAIARVPRLTLRQRAFWLFYLAEALLLGRWMLARNLNHLHVHFAGAVANVGMLASAAWRIPFSLTVHGPEELLNHDACHLREKLSAASFVFCISDFCRSQLLQLAPPSRWANFEVIRLGVDPVLLSPVSRSRTSAITPPGPRPLQLVSIGRLVPAKGHRILLEAIHLLRSRGHALHLTLIGAGPDRAALESFIAEQQLAGSVTLTQGLSHPQTLDLLRRADLFALASFAEGIPVALMEAMSLGIPCVSTSIAGIPELIRTGHDGLLVPPGNGEALADALECLIADPNLRQTIAHSARQRILTLYNLPRNHELLAARFTARLSGPQEPAP